MRDLAEVLDALLGMLPPEYHDPALLADALWIAAAFHDPSAEEGGDIPGSRRRRRTKGEEPSPEQPTPYEDRDTRRDVPEDRGETRSGSRHGPYGLYEHLPEPLAENDEAEVSVAAGRALSQAVELGRSLRPFMRRFPRGRRIGLDLAATVDAYTRDGELLPVVRPLPEPWFDVLLVIDTHPSMQVWQGAVQEFATLLSNSGAFRQVQQWFLSTEPHPDMTDARGRVINSRNVAVPDQRRLVLVVSDCAAPAWYGNEVWQLLRDWAGHSSVSIVNPLPSRLWHRTALDLPAVRVRGGRPGASNTLLTVTVPPHLRAVLKEGTTYVAFPTLTLTSHSLDRWAHGLVRGSPDGYEAVLVTPFGAPEDPFASARGDAPDGRDLDRAGAGEAFIRTASPAAVRLAALGSAFRRLSLSLIQLINQEVVPEATTSDVAELLMSEVLDVSSGGDSHVITFREQARAPLSRAAGRHDAWLLLDALSRYISKRVRLPGTGLNAIAALDTDELDEELRPFAYASEDLVAALRAGQPGQHSGAGGGQGQGALGGVFLPDPLRSAAVLIGALPADTEDGRADGPPSPLDGLSALLTSPEGWNLPDERCLRLPGAGAAEVRRALHSVAAMADEALLVWFVGHGEQRQEDSTVWLLGSDGERLHPHGLLDDLGVAHLLVVEDRCSPPGPPTPAVPAARHPARTNIQWLTYERPQDGRPGELTTTLLRTLAAGVTGAPPLLTLDQLIRGPDPDMVNATLHRSTVQAAGGPVAALARNRAVEAAPRTAASDASVTRLLSEILTELRLSETDDALEASAAENVLRALLELLASRVGRPRPDRRLPYGTEAGTFRMELESFLDACGLSVLADTHFPLLCRLQSDETAVSVPLVVLNFDDVSRWVQPYAFYSVPEQLRWAPFAVLLVLEGSRDARRHTLAERVKVAHDAGVGVVTLYFPPAPAALAPSADPTELSAGEFRSVVEEYCAWIVGSEAPSAQSVLLHVMAVGGHAVPGSLSYTHLLSLRPRLSELRLPAASSLREVGVPTTAELVGLLPASRGVFDSNVTVLSGGEEDDYVFVKAEVQVILVFDVRSSLGSEVQLLRVESAAG